MSFPFGRQNSCFDVVKMDLQLNPAADRLLELQLSLPQTVAVWTGGRPWIFQWRRVQEQDQIVY